MKYQALFIITLLLLSSCSSDSGSEAEEQYSSEHTLSFEDQSSFQTPSSATLQNSSIRASSSSTTATISSNSANRTGTFTDARDGRVYNWQKMTVSISSPVRNPVYMAENLAYVPPSGNSWCYQDQATNCEKYGRLYSWETVMNGAASSQEHPSGVQGICPDGWHLPSLQEWETLTEIAMYKNTYMNLTGWDPSGTTTPSNYSGFSALPAGQRLAEEGGDDEGNAIWYSDEGFKTYFWSSTKLELQFAIAWNIDNTDEGFGLNKFHREAMNIDAGLSVRCVQDQ